MPDGALFEGEPQVHVAVHAHRTSRGALAVLVVTAALGVLATGVIHAAKASADPTPSCDATTCTVSFGTAGTTQQWSVPAGVSTITVDMAGGSGGSSAAGGQGGPGGAMVATVPVFSGENLSVLQGTAPFPGGDFGGGGAPGGAGGPVPTGGWGGGGSFVFETNPTATLLLAVGGGGGAGGDKNEVAGAGGSNGPGSDATTNFVPSVVGLGGTLAAGGGGGAGNQGPFANGSAGAGPAMAPSNPGAGGSGGASSLPAVSSGGGGGGGYFGGGGGGVQDPAAVFAGAGGGGSGFNDPSTTVESKSTNTGDGSVTITYPVPVTTTTSGVLRDATNGAPIPNSCVVFSPAAFPGQTNFTNVGGDGTWSFNTAESGPFNLAFYTTANGDCSQPILPTPVPSWYINQPLSGTDEHVITPPPGATTVDAGTSGIVACLGATALPTAPCATPQVDLSGHVDTTGPVPLANVCVFALDSSGNGVALAMTDAQGNWSMAGLPADFNVVVAFIPFFGGTDNPCGQGSGGGGNPPVPPAGALQPVFYGNVWINLADPVLLNDPYTWAVARGATVLNAPTANVNACITTAAGTVVPRPSCSPTAAVVAANGQTTPAAAAPSASPLLAFTGATFLPLVTFGSGLLVAGLALLAISSIGRRRWLHGHLRTAAVPLRHTNRRTGPLSRIAIPSRLQRSRRQAPR
jgi:hypothetical protein